MSEVTLLTCLTIRFQISLPSCLMLSLVEEQLLVCLTDLTNCEWRVMACIGHSVVPPGQCAPRPSLCRFVT